MYKNKKEKRVEDKRLEMEVNQDIVLFSRLYSDLLFPNEVTNDLYIISRNFE